MNAGGYPAAPGRQVQVAAAVHHRLQLAEAVVGDLLTTAADEVGAGVAAVEPRRVQDRTAESGIRLFGGRVEGAEVNGRLAQSTSAFRVPAGELRGRREVPRVRRKGLVALDVVA